MEKPMRYSFSHINISQKESANSCFLRFCQ